MKSRKVLLGLFVGLAMCFVGTATAQNANYQNNKLVEIGPDNIGGRVTSLVVFGGGLRHRCPLFMLVLLLAVSFSRSDDAQAIWQYVPCYLDGEEITLPISQMLKLDDNTILIGTGESYYGKGNKVNKLAALGRGLFLFNTDDALLHPSHQHQPRFTTWKPILLLSTIWK